MKLRTLGSVFATALASACAELPDGAPGVGLAPEYEEVEAAATTLPDLTASISGPSSVAAGVPASFSVSTSNIGLTKAFSPRIDVILPTGYTPTALSGCTWTLSTRTIRCAFTAMNAGQTRTASYTVSTPATAGTLVQTARAYLSGTDGNSANNVATLTTAILGANLGVAVAGPTSLAGGSVGSYVATVTNTGTVSATSAWLTFTFPIGGWPTSMPGCTVYHSPERVRCSLGTVTPGATLTRTVDFGFPYAVANYPLTITVAGATVEPALTNGNNTASLAVATTPVTAVPVTLSVPTPQAMLLTNCFGDPGDFGSFVACDPAWLQSGVITFLDGGIIDTGDPGVNGAWSQPNGPESLEFEFTDALTGELYMFMEGFGVSGSCFEGLNWWPTETENRGAFQLCTI